MLQKLWHRERVYFSPQKKLFKNIKPKIVLQRKLIPGFYKTQDYDHNLTLAGLDWSKVLTAAKGSYFSGSARRGVQLVQRYGNLTDNRGRASERWWNSQRGRAPVKAATPFREQCKSNQREKYTLPLSLARNARAGTCQRSMRLHSRVWPHQECVHYLSTQASVKANSSLGICKALMQSV